MRGAERPAKVRWTHPFLLPLQPLSDEASRQTFVDIADDFHNSQDISELLSLTGNMPLAVDLIAHLVDYEGSSRVLEHWKTEKSSLISDGYNTRSSLSTSITMSLSSPRLSSLPDAKMLLSILSILPDGISEEELLQSNLPISDLGACKAGLLRTSLAYTDDKRHLRALVPIQEHMQHFHPPSSALALILQKHFQSLLDFYAKYMGSMPSSRISNNIAMNLGNIHSILGKTLSKENTNVEDAIYCTILLHRFCKTRGYSTALMDHITNILPHPCSPRLKAYFITEVLAFHMWKPIGNPELLIMEATTHFQHFSDPALQHRFNLAAGNYYAHTKRDRSAAMSYYNTALSLAVICEDPGREAYVCIHISQIWWQTGDYPGALVHSQRAQRLAKISGNLHQEARSVDMQALCLMELGAYNNSILLYCQARELLALCGMSGSNMDYDILSKEAAIHAEKSEYHEARSIHMQIAHKVELEPYMCAISLVNIAGIDVMIGGRTEDVQDNLEKAREVFTTFEHPIELVVCDMTLGDLYLRGGDIFAAKTSYHKCLNSSWGTIAQIASYCLEKEKLADTARWTPIDANWSTMWTVVYLAHAYKLHHKLQLHKALYFFGNIFLSRGDEDTAHSLFDVALAGFTNMDVHSSRAECMLGLGDIANKRGDSMKAVEFWRDARPLFEKSLQRKDVARVDARISTLSALSSTSACIFREAFSVEDN